MRYLVIGATATMALLGAATLASAQAPDDKSKAPAAENRGSGTDGKATQGRAGDGTQRSQGETKGAPPRTGADAGKDQPKATQGQSERSKSTERSQDRDKQKATRQQDQGKDRQKATQQQRDMDKQKSTRQQQDRDKQKSTGRDQQDKDKQKATRQQDRGGDKSKSAQGSKQQGRVQVSEQQRSTVRERLSKRSVKKTRINVSVNVGTRIPRSVHLHALPAFVFDVAPAYRGYSYVVLEDDTIVVVDPRTYVIVDLIRVDSQRADRPARGQLTLTREEMRFVYDAVPRDRTAEVRARLALGARVPASVELLAFPGDVTRRIPELDDYRFVVSGGDVIIVDPRDHDVVLVIEQ
jgi:hypothetical protein